jgi:hypothetical protein
MGAMGTLEGLCGTHPLWLTEVLAVVQALIEASVSATFLSGQWENSKSLRHVPTVVDQSVGRSCASVSRGKLVSNFPIGRWDSGTTYTSAEELALCKTQASAAVVQGGRSKRVSNFPIGAMGFCRRGWHVLVPGRTTDRSKL